MRSLSNRPGKRVSRRRFLALSGVAGAGSLAVVGRSVGHRTIPPHRPPPLATQAAACVTGL